MYHLLGDLYTMYDWVTKDTHILHVQVYLAGSKVKKCEQHEYVNDDDAAKERGRLRKEEMKRNKFEKIYI